MMKAKIILAGLVAASLLVSAGCGSKADPESQPPTAPHEVQTKVPETHERTSKELKASFDSLTDGSSIMENYLDNEISFSNEAKLYGMNSETAALVTFRESSFRCYVLNLKVSNSRKYDLTVRTVLSPDNGKNGIWVCGVSQFGAFDVAARGTAKMPITVLVDGSVVAADAVEQTLRGMTLSLEYTDTADDDTQPTGETGTISVNL